MNGDDPAVLFYTADFLVGIMTMTDEQVGKYIRLLCIQHQSGGYIPSEKFEKITAGDSAVKDKFRKCGKGYYNGRMLEEIKRRKNWKANISSSMNNYWREKKEKKTERKKSGDNLPVAISEEHELILNGFREWMKQNHPNTERALTPERIEKWHKTLTKLHNKGFSDEQIKRALSFAMSDDFWSKKMMSVSYLEKTNKDGNMYITVFLDSIKSSKSKIERAAERYTAEVNDDA